MTTYVVKTDLPPEAVNRIGLEIYKLWLDFALGRGSVGGRRLMYPSGKYASAIQFRQEGVATVAIIADESVAPEVGILETGHGRVDLKTKLQRGRAYPMHGHRISGGATRRAGPAAPARGLRMYASTSAGGVVTRARAGGVQAKMWAEVRSGTASGYASIGPNSPPDSWIIPPMLAYAPAANLARLAAQMARGGT
jgi:hypothetical protein